MNMRCTYCNTMMVGNGTGVWCPNADCDANVGNPRPHVPQPELPQDYEGQPCDHAWAQSLASVMLTNDHPPGILNLCRCYAALVKGRSPLPSAPPPANLDEGT